MRAVGSGHSWSDVALTTGYLLRPERLNRPLEITGNLVRVEAGMRLRELNRHLDDNGLALSNMGGYDAQTVAGVMSTSTHGSGIEFGPIADSVRSLDLVASGGRVIRIERADGHRRTPSRRAAQGRRHLRRGRRRHGLHGRDLRGRRSRSSPSTG